MRGIELHDGSRCICRRRGLALAQERSQSFQIGRTDHASPYRFAKIVLHRCRLILPHDWRKTPW
jgi:hypothetical protein